MTTLETIDEITELNDISEFMQDEQLDEALQLVVELIVKGDLITPVKINKLILKLQAISAMCGIKATYYQNFVIAGSEQKKRKNVYYTMNDKIDRVVDALKIVQRYSI